MKKNEKLILFIPLIIITLTFIAVLVRGHINLNDINFDKLSGFGSFIGGIVGTCLTIVATLYIYKTYHTQKEELESQKTELILQRQLIAQQQFESTFFNMLNVHRELKNGLYYSELIYSVNPHNNEYIGPEVINFINKKFKKNFNDLKYNQQNKIETIQNFELNLEKYESKNAKNILTVVYNNLFEDYQNNISHYCRNAYHILKFIREYEINKSLGNDLNKYKNYANIFQSQLNVDEQFLLFYNFIHFNDENKGIYSTINLVNHYEFLENLGSNNLLDKELHNNKNFYTFNIK